MKRRKNSCDLCNRNGSDYSILNFPEDIIVDILLKLPAKEIVMSKCVCKTWLRIISDHKFSEMHFAHAQANPLIRLKGSTHISRLLYLVNPLESCLGYCRCDDLNCNCGPDVSIKLDAKLQIPLRNTEIVRFLDMVPNSENAQGGIRRKRCLKLNPRDHKLKIVNSCNGLLCLSEPSHNDPVIVCNPLTGEYINLPDPLDPSENDTDCFDCGIGFSPKTNEYKVIRMFHGKSSLFVHHPVTVADRYASRLAEVHTLGTSSWKVVGYAPGSLCVLTVPTYLNGALHWFFVGSYPVCSDFIFSFDFGTEQFQIVPPPTFKNGVTTYDDLRKLCMGVIMDCLCICDASLCDHVGIWVMKKYGEQKSWTKMFSIDNLTTKLGLFGLYSPISYSESGILLMFNYFRSTFIYYDIKKMKLKLLRIHGVKSKFEAVAHTSSFILLRDAVKGDNVEVLNITSRQSEIKLPGETKDIFLVPGNNVKEWVMDLSSQEVQQWMRYYWGRTGPPRRYFPMY